MNSQIPNLISIGIAFTPHAIRIWTELAYLNFHLKTALLMYFSTSSPWKLHVGSLILFSIRACFVLFIQNRLSENHKMKVNGIASNWNHLPLFISHTHTNHCVCARIHLLKIRKLNLSRAVYLALLENSSERLS